jgi:hypothetical protein
MSHYFCGKFSKTFANIFDNVLNHKSLRKEDKNGGSSGKSFSGIEIKNFSFSFAVDHGLKFSTRQLHSTEHHKGEG